MWSLTNKTRQIVLITRYKLLMKTDFTDFIEIEISKVTT